MEIFIGCDHAGYKLKQAVKKHLEEKGHKTIDLGSFNEEAVDYPVIAREVAEKVQEHPEAMGIMICGTGQGSAMVLNRHKKVRAAVCNTEELAKRAIKDGLIISSKLRGENNIVFPHPLTFMLKDLG